MLAVEHHQGEINACRERESNPRGAVCKTVALASELPRRGRPDTIRTCNLVVRSHALIQLSFGPKAPATGLEPAAISSTGRCSTVELHRLGGRSGI